jgi:hypothetical protein
MSLTQTSEVTVNVSVPMVIDFDLFQQRLGDVVLEDDDTDMIMRTIETATAAHVKRLLGDDIPLIKVGAITATVAPESV